MFTCLFLISASLFAYQGDAINDIRSIAQIASEAPTPPMGWNSWNVFGCNIDSEKIREITESMVESGMADAGYKYVVVDDCWAVGRDENNRLIADPIRFPEGMRALADFVHSKGLKFGIYTAVGPETCMKRPGSFQHEAIDAQTFADWGVDFVKADLCSWHPDMKDNPSQYKIFSDALKKSGRGIVLSICEYGNSEPWRWGAGVGTMWRTTSDITNQFSRILEIVDFNKTLWPYAGPGRFNDPDMLEVGNGLTNNQNRIHFGLWAIMAAPLIAGNDLRVMASDQRKLLTNKDIIAVNQDPLGIQGRVVKTLNSGVEVFVKKLSTPGTRAVAALNRSPNAADVTVYWSELGLGDGEANVRSLFDRKNLGSRSGFYTFTVPPMDLVMFTVSGREPVPKLIFLSDLAPFFQMNGYGPMERDKSNGEKKADDGRAIFIRGQIYWKGLGVHAPSWVALNIPKGCIRFRSAVGVDDETEGRGKVRFAVYGETSGMLFESEPLDGTSPVRNVDVALGANTTLHLLVMKEGDIAFDHADWANAHFLCAQ